MMSHPLELEIRMQSRGQIECYICGQEDVGTWGVPVVNGDVVSNDFPDHLWEKLGGGVSVCEECYEKHARGEVPTFDRFYLHLAAGFEGGAGI